MLATLVGLGAERLEGGAAARCACAGLEALTATGFAAAPYVEGPFPNRSLESIQNSASGPPPNDTLKTSS